MKCLACYNSGLQSKTARLATILARMHQPKLENYVKHLKHKNWSGIIVVGLLSVTAARNNTTERWEIDIDLKTKQNSSVEIDFLQSSKTLLRLKKLSVVTRSHATHVSLMTEHYLRMQSSNQGE